MIHLGLGANQGARAENLARGIGLLQAAGFALDKVSPAVESAAVLPPDAKPEWNRAYLNLAVAGDADWTPAEALRAAKDIERQLGRNKDAARWAPRPLDIDILTWHGRQIDEADLQIPHPDAMRRDFVLTPLLHLQPDLRLGRRTLFELTQTHKPIPLWMAVVNVTPDSFSGDGAGGGEMQARLDGLLESGVQIIDLGAESTAPGAGAITPEEEWRRLRPPLAYLHEKLAGRVIKPWVCIDSRNPRTLEKCLDYGVDLINDVGGLRDKNMLALVRDSGLPAVAMHSLTLPASKTAVLPPDKSATAQVGEWIGETLERCAANQIANERIIIDPGIGFGKTALQSLELLQNCKRLRGYGCRILVGHSRKSFMNDFCAHAFAERDIETAAISLALTLQGVDIIRVHNVEMHQRAWRAWMHMRGSGG